MSDEADENGVIWRLRKRAQAWAGRLSGCDQRYLLIERRRRRAMALWRSRLAMTAKERWSFALG